MNPAGSPPKNFALWLGAFFLTVLGAQLWVVWLYGSALPFWDQWDEALTLFKPWQEGHLTLADVAAPASDHRILLTHWLDMGLIKLNGRWDPLLQMTVNAAIHGVYACGLAFGVWHFLGRKNGWFVCVLLLPFFTLPYAGENAIWGMNSLWYLVNVFGLATITGLGFGRVGSWPWWSGVAAALLGMLTMALGPLALGATAGLILLRAARNQRLDKGNLLSLGICLVLIGGGAALSPRNGGDHPLQAHSLAEFAAALLRQLCWPFLNVPFMACLMVLPLALLLVYYLRPGFPFPRAAEWLLALGLWSALQSAALAFGRANYGEGVPASRYMEVFNVLVIASLFAAVLLGERWQRAYSPKVSGLLLPLVFAGIVFFGMSRMAQIVVDNLLLPTRMMNLVAEERVATFAATGNQRDLLESPTIRPNAQTALTVLREPKLQAILPPACRPPAAPRVDGPLTVVSQYFLRHSIAILSGGLILFGALGGWGMARGSMDLTMKRPEGWLALLTALVALGFVGMNHSLRREAVEYRLERQLADYFQATGNTNRAVIHNRKAEALESFK